MITLLLLGFALLLSVGSRVLTRSEWATRSPAWGIWAWQTTSISAALALVLAGVVVAIPATPLRDEFAGLLRSCSHALAEHYETPGGVFVAALGLVASVGIAARFSLLATTELRIAARRRAGQRQTLQLVAVADPRGFQVLDHDLPLVYCLPGRSGTVVVTRGAVDALSSHQLDLVLAHERRHLRVRHHLALTFATALSRTFYGWGVFGVAREQIAALVEMQADDAIRQDSDRKELAGALLTLAPVTAGAALGASGSHRGAGCEAEARLDRLTRASAPVRRTRLLFAAAAGGVLLAAPVALALSPAVEAATGNCCSVDVPALATPSALGQVLHAGTD